MLLLPCNIASSGFGSYFDIDEQCEVNLEDQINYIGQSQVQMLVNKERFMPQQYGEETVERFSTIIGTQFDETKPSWA